MGTNRTQNTKPKAKQRQDTNDRMWEEPRSKSTAHKTGPTLSKRNAKGHLTVVDKKKSG